MNKNINEELSGFLLVNKPEGKTSFDCIRALRKVLTKKTKIGHAGTLDPFAEGLLIIGIGRATKNLAYFQNLPKQYEATAQLNLLTTTLDRTGTPINQHPISFFSEKTFKETIATFLGGYEQTPPAFSALKHQGRSLYKYARTKALSQAAMDAILESKKRFVSIYDLRITHYEHPFFNFTATVSKGTYVRCLAHDMAAKCGSVATTVSLKRTLIGHYSVENALTITSTITYKDIHQSLFQVIAPKQTLPLLSSAKLLSPLT